MIDVEVTGPILADAPDNPPTVAAEFFDQLPGSLQQSLFDRGFAVQGWQAPRTRVRPGGPRPVPGTDARIPNATLLGRTRASVEAEHSGGTVYGWQSVERALEPATDPWAPPYWPFPGRSPRHVEFVAPLLAQADPDAVPVWADSQYVSLAGYIPDGSHDPPVVMVSDITEPPLEGSIEHLRTRLAHFLLGRVVYAALFHSPVRVHTRAAEADEVDRRLRDLVVTLPGTKVRTDGSVLVLYSCRTLAGTRTATVTAAAQVRADIAARPVGLLTGLSWRYADQRSQQYRPFGER